MELSVEKRTEHENRRREDRLRSLKGKKSPREGSGKVKSASVKGEQHV